MENQSFVKSFAEMLQEENTEVTGETKLEALENWDSLTVLEFLTLADEQYGVELEIDELSACDTVGDIGALIEKSKPNTVHAKAG